jgi:hypothetical protein
VLFNSWRYPAAIAVAVGITFPALAVAANSGGAPAHAGAKPRQAIQLRSPGAGPLIRPARQLDKTIQVQVKAIRAEKRRKHKQAFAHLPGGVSLTTLNAIAACESAAIRTRSRRMAAIAASISLTTAPGRRSAATAIPPRRRRPSRTTAPRCSTRAAARAPGRSAARGSGLEAIVQSRRRAVLTCGAAKPSLEVA